MAWTQTDIDKLQQAISDGRGVRSIAFGDQITSFNSIDDMLKLLATMQAAVNTPAGGSRTRYGVMDKGC